MFVLMVTFMHSGLEVVTLHNTCYSCIKVHKGNTNVYHFLISSYHLSLSNNVQVENANCSYARFYQTGLNPTYQYINPFFSLWDLSIILSAKECVHY